MIDYACTRSIPQAADNAPSILVISDGCNVGLKSAQGRVKAYGGLLGVLNDGEAPGLMLHASLAIDVDRSQVVGLADTIMFSRSKKLAGESRHKATGGKVRGDKRLTRKEKESYATWTIARMGGWKVYRSKPPGPKVIARGLKDFLRFAELTIRIKNSNNELLL
jgi:hypothetical protein